MSDFKFTLEINSKQFGSVKMESSGSCNNTEASLTRLCSEFCKDAVTVLESKPSEEN